tara:strand:+ start:24604 stop:25836 length:1233 start_codon:yes stop_codon:yes gene_type:complete
LQKPVEQKPKVPIKYRGSSCLNCEHSLDLSDRYCPYCGQINSIQKLSLSTYFNEFIGSVFNYDSRFRYTIKDLLIRPGSITHDYVNGKRLKYANPFRFFLSITIIFFLLSSLINFFEGNESNGGHLKMREIFNTSSENDLDIIPKDSIAYYRDNNATLQKDTLIDLPFEYTVYEEIEKKGAYVRLKTKLGTFTDFSAYTEIDNASEGLDSLQYPKTKFNLWLYERSSKINTILDDPVAFSSYVLEKIPFFLFFFAPVFALAFVPLFIRKESYSDARSTLKNTSVAFFRKLFKIPVLGPLVLTISALVRRFFNLKTRFNYIEHVIFIFHIFSFVFLGLLILAIPDVILGAEVLSSLFIIFICPFYFYKALRNFYRESRLRTILKFLILNFVFLIAMVFGMIIFLIVSAATY